MTLYRIVRHKLDKPITKTLPQLVDLIYVNVHLCSFIYLLEELIVVFVCACQRKH